MAIRYVRSGIHSVGDDGCRCFGAHGCTQAQEGFGDDGSVEGHLGQGQPGQLHREGSSSLYSFNCCRRRIIIEPLHLIRINILLCILHIDIKTHFFQKEKLI